MRMLLVSAMLISLPVLDARADDPPPPQGAKQLSELLSDVEKSTDFRYIDEVEWDDGAYEVEYYTQAGEKKKVRIDPVSGDKTK